MANLSSVANLIIDGDWIESKDQSESGIRLIQTGNIGVGEYLDKTDKAKYISEETFKELKCTEVIEGDILVSRLPDPIGRACIVPQMNNKCITAVDCTIIRLNKELCDSRYFVHYTCSDIYNMRLSTFFSGSTRTRISRKNLEKTEIPLPPLETQRQIAANLDKVTHTIDLCNAILEKLDLLVKSRFVEMFRNKNYPYKELISLIIEGAGLSYGIVVPGDNVDNGVPMIRPSDFKNGVLDLSNLYMVSESIECKYAKTRLRGNEILVQVIGQPGQIMMTDSRCNGMNVTRNLAVVRPNNDIVNTTYLCEYMKKDESQRFMIGETKQSTLKQLPLNRLKQLKVFLPPLELQKQFAAFVEQTDKSKLAVKQVLEKAETLKKALMQEYFG